MTTALLVVCLIVIGVVLMVIEVLVIPGFGLIGILGGASMVAACYVAFIYGGKTYGGLSVLAGLLSSGLVFFIMPYTKSAKKMVLNAAIDQGAAAPSQRALLGAEGVAASDLRPSGLANIDGQVVDVVTDGEYIERGMDIVVVHVAGARVVVETIS